MPNVYLQNGSTPQSGLHALRLVELEQRLAHRPAWLVMEPRIVQRSAMD